MDTPKSDPGQGSFFKEEGPGAEGSAGPDAPSGPAAPLADRLRPTSLDEVVGQEHLTGRTGPLRGFVERGEIPSILLWGPAGSGKTTLARILGRTPGYVWEQFSAVLSGVKEVRAAVERARYRREARGTRTLLFVDEIHRFNKAQQDAFLPHVESGVITLIGATTENPSFEVNSALLSRCRVYVLRALTGPALRRVADAALAHLRESGAAPRIELEPAAFQLALRHADGDARKLLNLIELVAQALARPGDGPGKRGLRGADRPGSRPVRAGSKPDEAPVESARAGSSPEAARRESSGAPPPAAGTVVVTLPEIEAIVQQNLPRHLGAEDHFDWISALQKSIRGSDPHAAVYWVARMLEAGEDPKYVARRLVRTASEDIGLAEPGALAHTLAAKDAVEFLGAPECFVALAQAAVYLALAPKSNSLTEAYGRAAELIRERGALPVPLRLRNAPTRLMEELGYGEDYRYPHAFEGHWVPESYLPETIAGERIYRPSREGKEPRMIEDHARRTRNFYRLRAGSAEGGGAKDPEVPRGQSRGAPGESPDPEAGG
jgi:putative ATPase